MGSGTVQRRRRHGVSPDRHIPIDIERAKYHIIDSANPQEDDRNLRQSLATALGLDDRPDGRIFRLQPCRSAVASRSRMATNDLLSDASSLITSDEESADEEQVKESNLGLLTLDAPGLVNDYYRSLVAWSSSSYHIAVGLGSRVFLWRRDEGSTLIPFDNDYSAVTCLQFSCDNCLAIGRKDGSLTLYDVNKQVTRVLHVHIEAPLCYVAWLPGSNCDLFIGDDIGEVVCLRVVESPLGSSVEVRSKLRAHTQQICGIEISIDLKQMAVGGNDNLVTLWNIQDLDHPTLQFRMNHRAAVKALAFCPWAPRLLATGGGTNDRTVRFWHSRTGTLLEMYNVKGQVTGIAWSKHYKQLAVTFGFGAHERPMLACIYSYPQFKLLVLTPPSTATRLLSTVLSPDGDAICCAANDGTVRFYELWKNQERRLSTPQPGLYGSDIIQMLEGIDKPGEMIR